jgi:hypothetical protein
MNLAKKNENSLAGIVCSLSADCCWKALFDTKAKLLLNPVKNSQSSAETLKRTWVMAWVRNYLITLV